ncbi:uncharacterized protein LOC124169030 [Ischnura elegans]|uniref:uncharacterized protein LOC124169030 n=1 Tax=Ischnura elegans TaxID=197161 RepID=UPI001ED8B88A|nr:uncharacterized protein LOC124169030 [Ischnura elegans]
MRSGNFKSSEYALRAMMQAAEAEKLRLMELMAVLNKRLKEEQSQKDYALKQLEMEKRKQEKTMTWEELEARGGEPEEVTPIQGPGEVIIACENEPAYEGVAEGGLPHRSQRQRNPKTCPCCRRSR